jgi:hypothetical protein
LRRKTWWVNGERVREFSNRSVLLSVEANADAKDGSWRIVVKNSKIAGLRKSRKCSALPISAAGTFGLPHGCEIASANKPETQHGASE